MSQLEKQQRSASVVGGKTARACDGCLRRRARWYCAADDAFLCQECDASVHSANPLARRHERVRLKTASSSSVPSSLALKSDHGAAPAWHQGFKRKARTPRPKPSGTHVAAKSSESLVPDLEAALTDETGEEEQLLYRVPIFDPVLAEFCSPPPPSLDDAFAEDAKPSAPQPLRCTHTSTVAAAAAASTDGFAGFLPSDMELAQFAADMETLLGRGLDGDSFCMEGLGLVDSRGSNDASCCPTDAGHVKTEMDEDAAIAGLDATCNLDLELDLSRDTLDLNFDCGSPLTGEDADEQKLVAVVSQAAAAERKLTLELDYEAVMETWASCHGSSPWTDGQRPQFNPDDCWPDFMGMWGGGEMHGMYGEAAAAAAAGGGVAAAAGDGGREARVTRYREKRRTRLFSKKIRYEVRKLNAEKRPRMKGRFVKRAPFPAVIPATGPPFAY